MRIGLLCVCLCFPLLLLRVPTDPAKPTLYVVESESCGPCRDFGAAWTNTPGFADRLRSGFNVRALHWENEQEQNLAKRLGVTRLPSFVVVSPRGQNLGMIVGFTGVQPLLQELRLPLLAQNVSQSRPIAPETPKAKAGATVDESARREISRLESSMETLRRQLRDVGKSPDSSDELQALKRSIEELKAAASRVEPPPASAPDISTEMPTPIRTPAEDFGGAWSGLLAFALRAGAAVALPEVAIPAAAFSVLSTVGGWWLGRRRSRRSAAAVGGAVVQSRMVPIAVDSPPAPQVVHTETRFVDIQKDDFARAHAWAVEQVARKYPGSATYLEALESLIKQFLNAKG